MILIVWLALFLRVWQLDTLPPGLHYDEAFDATNARAILRGGERPIFFVGNFGEEPAHIYFETLVFAIVGESPWAARLSGTILGLLVIPALYFCGRAFFPKQGWAAVIAAFIAAILFWALAFSRSGLLTTSFPAILTLGMGALAKAYASRSLKWSIIAGFFIGASFYTYLASRMWLIVLPLWFIYLVIFHRAEIRSRLKAFAALVSAAFVTALPLGLFFLANPVALSARVGQVLVFDTLVTNVLRTAGMFFISGDTDPRSNIPGQVALDPILSILLLMGIGVALWRFRQVNVMLLLIWFVVLCLPSALTEFAPNLRRSLGAMPATALLCAVGWNALWEFFVIEKRARILRWAAIVFLLGGLFVSAFYNTRLYFVEWASRSGAFYSFDVGILQLAQKLAARPSDEQLCISPAYQTHPTVLWAMDGRAFSSFDGRHGIVLPNSAHAATCAIITYEDNSASLQRYYPNADKVDALLDYAGMPYAEILHFPANQAPQLEIQTPLNARVGETIRVLGYNLDSEKNRARLQVFWRAEKPTPRDYTVFAHLIGPPHPKTNDTVWAQADKRPNNGMYPTTQWQPGETIIETYEFAFPPEAVPGEYRIAFGMYEHATQARAPLWLNEAPAPDNRILTQPFFKTNE